MCCMSMATSESRSHPVVTDKKHQRVGTRARMRRLLMSCRTGQRCSSRDWRAEIRTSGDNSGINVNPNLFLASTAPHRTAPHRTNAPQSQAPKDKSSRQATAAAGLQSMSSTLLLDSSTSTSRLFVPDPPVGAAASSQAMPVSAHAVRLTGVSPQRQSPAASTLSSTGRVTAEGYSWS